ncbi:MAG: metal-dependent transcriptional regulator [Planctomycetota bacterium]|nr:metal-dependent transcriptional regulator [Planctomycetota bacterium]
MPKSLRAVSASQQDYLKAIYALAERGGWATTTELADHLGVRAPSVTAMVQKLAEAGYVSYSPRQGARLLKRGRVAAIQVIRRHRLLETFLVEVLGMDWSEVHDEAEVLEHHLSERMVQAIDRVLGHPAEDPHGRPIPDADSLFARRELTPLGDLAVGESGFVRELRIEAPERLQRWKELGLVPGAAVTVTKRQEMEDVMHLLIGERPVVTGSEGVEGVYVETN